MRDRTLPTAGPFHRRIAFERDTKVSNAGTFILQREDHTIGNAVRMCARGGYNGSGRMRIEIVSHAHPHRACEEGRARRRDAASVSSGRPASARSWHPSSSSLRPSPDLTWTPRRNRPRRQLLGDKDVLFAGYKIPHPLEYQMIVKVTRGLSEREGGSTRGKGNA